MNKLEGTRLRLVMFLVTGAMFMEVLDGNIIATTLPAMGRSFGVEALQLNIAMSAYLLALGVFIPVSAWMADRFGSRRVFSIAIAGFTLTSLLCGLVDSLHAFIALRVLQGACGAMMVPVGRLLVLRHVPKERRMVAMSNLVWPALIAPVIAPPLGGFIASYFSWHWIFFLNVPLGLAAFVLALWLIPAEKPAAVKPFDWMGFVLFGLGIFLLLSGLEWLAVSVNAINISLFITGIVLIMAAVRHFLRASNPMLGLTPLRITTFRVAMLGGSASRMAFSCLPFLLPLMLQLGFGMDAFHAGLLLLVVFAGNVSMKAFTTPVLRRFGYRRVMLVNGSLAALGLACCALIGPETSLLVIIPLLLVNGMARSMQFTSLGTIAFADISDKRIADANGLFNVVNQVSLAAGITLAAMAVRLGEGIAGKVLPGVVAGEYKIAFIVAALVTLLGLIDVLRLPPGAGDQFLGRNRNPPPAAE